MQRESIIGLAVMITLAVLAPRAPVDDQTEASVAVPVDSEAVAFDEAPSLTPAADQCLLLYNYLRDDDDTAHPVRVDVTI